jgi:X-Pro dipeptidyl-peptidase C-terminal non-catalytic domain/RTX calcium-binding nonapeptide repeat (4 copies)
LSARAGLAAASAAVALLVAATPAGASIPASLTAGCALDTTGPEDYAFCDDGVPNAGGLFPNATGASAVTVPAKYGGDGYSGLPPSAGAPTDPGADATGNVALDVDVSYPNPADFSGPRPLLVFMHGCCSGSKASWESQTAAPGSRFDAGGELWHYSNAWFASRGYVVINFTARGFVDGNNRGSTGQTQLDSRSYEINDYQHLACQVTQLFNGVTLGLPDIDPSKVVATGGSYGGGFSWMALTDPFWNCANAGAPAITMRLAAIAPKYGWTDLVNSLVPTGTHSGRPNQLPDAAGCDSGPVHPDESSCPGPQTPIGIPKRSIVSALFISGASGVPPGSSHTTFPPSIVSTFACTQGPDLNPSGSNCPGVTGTLAEFLRERSAYYQQSYFDSLSGNSAYAIPVFAAGTFTDWLFPSTEHRQMVNRLRSINPNYPVQTYYGDYQHFTQNKAKVWGDVCNSGGSDHVCNNGDFAGNFNAAPASRVREGVTTRLNAFIDHYATTAAGPADPGLPAFDTTAELEVCPQNAASLGVAADAGGPQFSAPTFEQLAPNTLTVNAEGAQTTTNTAAPNSHSAKSDPVANLASNGGRCPVETDETPGPGVASYTSTPLPRQFTMLGGTSMTVNFAATGPVSQLDARLYDVLPDGTSLLVDRGPRRLRSTEASGGQVSYELFGSGWRFPPGHRVRIELAQDDDPFLHLTEAPSSAALSRAVLRIPIREPSATIGARPTLRSGRCANRTIGTKLGEKLIGSSKGDRIRGRRGADKILGRGGKDCLKGDKGKDTVAGGKGRDTVSGGSGKDQLTGGTGPDLIRARDHHRDAVACGKGKDRALVDRVDKVSGCEKVKVRRG